MLYCVSEHIPMLKLEVEQDSRGRVRTAGRAPRKPLSVNEAYEIHKSPLPLVAAVRCLPERSSAEPWRQLSQLSDDSLPSTPRDCQPDARSRDPGNTGDYPGANEHARIDHVDFKILQPTVGQKPAPLQGLDMNILFSQLPLVEFSEPPPVDEDAAFFENSLDILPSSALPCSWHVPRASPVASGSPIKQTKPSNLLPAEAYGVPIEDLTDSDGCLKPLFAKAHGNGIAIEDLTDDKGEMLQLQLQSLRPKKAAAP